MTSSAHSKPITIPNIPHYKGHRDRLRARFTKNPKALPDYELLELILFTIIPRRDVKPLAKTLLQKFGTLPAVIRSSQEELCTVPGISETAATTLKSMEELSYRLLEQSLQNKPIFEKWDDLLQYCQATMAHEIREQFRVLFLNKNNELIQDEIQQTGTVDHTPAYPREIMKRALELSATALILVHNHPSGNPEPSQSDIDLTQTIIQAANPFNIIIHDHIIVARSGVVSLRDLGHL